jgi:hypothetical protein
MQQEFFFHLARLPKRGYRAVLVAILLGAILALGGFSFAPATHAAGVVSPGTNASVVEIMTQQARSVLMQELSSPLPLAKCYNTPPNQVITISGLEGEVEFTGYSDRTCSGALLCRVIANIPASGFFIIRLC